MGDPILEDGILKVLLAHAMSKCSDVDPFNLDGLGELARVLGVYVRQCLLPEGKPVAIANGRGKLPSAAAHALEYLKAHVPPSCLWDGEFLTVRDNLEEALGIR